MPAAPDGFISLLEGPTVDDFKQFKSGSQFAAWMGLVPRQHSSGGKSNLGGITKHGQT